jgi:hypothetical protein
MRFGVASYALTFSAWQMFLNLVEYQRTEPPQVADLVVADVTTASKVQDGRTARITAIVANPGTAPAGVTTTEFVLDGQTSLGTVETASLPAGGSSQVSVDWNTRGVKGQHTIRVTSDSAGAVSEGDEGNNAGVLTVEVKGNRVQNGSFEQESSDGTGPAAWTDTGTAAGQTSWSRADGTEGSSAVAVTGTGGNAVLAGVPRWTSAPIEVTPGEVLDVTASVRTDGASSAPAVGMAYLGATGQVLDTTRVLTAPLTTDGFATLQRSLTIPVGVAELRLVLLGFAPTDTNTRGTVVFDNVGVYDS